MPVTIHRDDWGVPHVVAGSESDGFFGLGYAQAQDGAHVLLRNYLLVAGQMSSAFGAEFADLDFGALRWNHLDEARAGFGRLPVRLQDDATAFVDGVARFLEENPSQRPGWTPALEPALALAMHRVFLWDYAVGDAFRALAAGGVEPSADVLAEVHAEPAPPGDGASNEWVLMPERTAANALAILSDPHGSITGLPMFEFGLEAGALKLSGASILGGVLPTLAHNRHVAWAFTTGGPSVSDCYALTLDAADPERYVRDGASLPITRREVARAGRTRRFEEVRLNGVTSPIVARTESTAYAICTPYMHTPELMEREIYGWLSARDVSDVMASMETVGMFAQNVMVGDSHGNARYVRAGRVPVRAAAVDCSRPLDGSTEANDWRGIHPLRDLVQIGNPAGGYMQNNNIAPDTMFRGASETGLAARHPSYLFHDVPGRTSSRGARATELLESAVLADADDILAIALDDYWLGTDRWQLALRAAMATQGPPRDPDARAVAARLLDFDGHTRADSAGAQTYVVWRRVIGRDLPAEESRLLAEAVEAGQPTGRWDAALADAVAATVAELRTRYGRLDVTYGDVHRLGRGPHSFPAGGGLFLNHGPDRPFTPGAFKAEDVCVPLRVMLFEPSEDGIERASIGGRSLRLVQFTEPISSSSVILFGQSQHPGSPHYSDQARLVGERRVKSTYFDPDELADHIVSSETLSR